MPRKGPASGRRQGIRLTETAAARAVQSEWMPTASQITWSKIRVFMVFVAALAILAVQLYLLLGGALFQPKSHLYVYIPDATALDTDSPVRVNGVDVGKIRSIALSGSNQPDRIVQVVLTIEQQYLPRIPSDSYIQIESDSLMGNKYLNITPGRSPAPAQPNMELAFRPQQDLMKTLDVEQFTKQLRVVEALLDDIEQGKNPTGQLLLSDQLYNQVRSELRSFEGEIRRLQEPKNPVGKMLYTDEDYQRIRERLLGIDQTIETIQRGQGGLGKLVRDDDQYNQLRVQLDELQSSIKTLQSGPLLQSDAAYVSWNRELASLINSVNQFDVNPLLTSSELYDSLTGFAAEMRDNVHEFRTNPRKFLWIKLF
jgi:phospholipid/cholesterol/gamma-HCH transport system substrate-binding protein